MVSALALQKNFETSKHSQLIGWFNKNYIAQNKVETKYGRTIIKLFELRNKADYDVYASFTKEQSIELYENCNNFINRIEKLILNK